VSSAVTTRADNSPEILRTVKHDAPFDARDAQRFRFAAESEAITFVKDHYLRRNPPYLTDMLHMTDYADSSPVPHNRYFNFILYNQTVALSVPSKLLWRASCFMPS
jgi:hypothetical protein